MARSSKNGIVTIKGTYGPEYEIHDPGNGVIGAAVKTGHPYEAKLLYHIWRKHLKGTAVDVGAHVGNHTLWFAIACGLQVMAFEPLEYKRLMANLALNNLNGASGRVQASPVALGERPGFACEIHDHELARCKESAPDALPVAALDDFHLIDVSLIKIDVEGMEPEVLRGAQATILRCRPVVYAEAKDEEAHEANAREIVPLRYIRSHIFGATPMEEWIPCK